MTDNLNAARTVSTDRVWPDASLGLFLDGSGQTLGIWDGGNVRSSHVELAGRAINLDFAGLSDHATHVAGTMIGAGINANARGMSFAGSLRAYDFNNDETEMAAEQLLADPTTVSNHSYSFITGWIFGLFDSRWVWYGDVAIGSVEDHSFGFYDSIAADWDQIAFNSPNYLMVKSAGNDRNDVGAAPGVEHWHFDGGVGTFVLSSDGHPADGGASGYDSIASGSASAKNIITVGAVHDIPGGYVDPSDVVMSSFSGWGPTDDGRIKPDIIANGISLLSSVAGSNSSYANFNGTSMSSPNAAGSLGLLAQHAEDLFGASLRSATMKALVVHTANEAGPDPGPDYMSGWGLLNTAEAALLMSAHAGAVDTEHIVELELNDGAIESFEFTSDGAGPLRVTICWTDLPGAPPSTSVDPPNLMLVNDLDVRVIGPGSITDFPWVLEPATPSAAATRGDNFRDNTEQVHIDAPTSGTYTVEISHKGSLNGGNPQPVSLIVSGNVDSGAAVEIIIDNQDSATESTGTWPASSGPNPWAGQSAYNNGGNTFRWLPTIPSTATYAVYAWWTYHKNRSTTVPYRISHAGGILETIVNQQDAALGGKWNLIGTVTLNAGTGHYVEVSSENGQASADAVRFVSMGPLPLSIDTASLGDGVLGQMYSETLMASGGDPPYTWQMIAGTLPDGLTLNASSGEISGIPTTVESQMFTVEVEDGSGNTDDAVLTIDVVSAVVEIIIDNQDAETESTGTWSVSSGPNPWAGQSVYNNGGNTFRWLPTIPSTGTYAVYAWWTYHSNRSTTVPYRISHAGGILETIVNQQDAALGGKWNLIGTVTLNAGTGHYVEVSSENGQASADAVRFVSMGPLSLSIDTASLGNGVLAQMYSETLIASGGDPPYTWQVITGTLPDGLTLNASSGEISGIPTTVESQMFTVEVEDGSGNTDDAVLTIDVVSAVVEIVIDNQDAESESTGTWSVSSGPNPWAGQSVYNNGGNTFRWLPTIPSTATYAVYAWWTYHSNRSTTVPYRISHAGGILETIVNQHDAALGGQWNLIGTVTLNAGSAHYVEVSSENGQASADAVRFVSQ